MPRYKILVVDDEEDNLALLYRSLRRDYDVSKAHCAREALELLDQEDFQLVLSDHKMPEMEGVDFLKLVSEKHPSTVRVLITAYSDAKILIEAINKAKIYRYIKKPYQIEELLMVVQSALEYYQLKSDNEKLIKDLKELFMGAVKAITEALDAKDRFALGRSMRVCIYAVKTAESLNLPIDDIGKIELASLLHDIGIIGIDDAINNSSTYTQEEFEESKKHVFHSIKILEDIKQLNEVREIIKYHHENYDGTGYPYGIKGEEIPIGSKIIAIADKFENLISNKEGSPSMTNDEALKIIKEQAGHEFDPNLVGAFESIVQNAQSAIREYEMSEKKERISEERLNIF